MLKNWTSHAEYQQFIISNFSAMCIGCTLNKIPSLGAHYDFISRLWMSDLASDIKRLKII